MNNIINQIDELIKQKDKAISRCFVQMNDEAEIADGAADEIIEKLQNESIVLRNKLLYIQKGIKALWQQRVKYEKSKTSVEKEEINGTIDTLIDKLKELISEVI